MAETKDDEQAEQDEKDNGDEGSARSEREESEDSGKAEREDNGDAAKAEGEESEDAGEAERKDEGDEDSARSEREDEDEDEDEGPARSERDEDAEEELEPHELSGDELVGMDVIDSHGIKIGTIDALFIHQQEERANWARVKTGIGPLGSHTFIPLHDAQDEDGKVRVVYEKEHVNEAPEIEPEGNEIADDEADQLHSHYGLERVQGLARETKDEDIELPRDARDANPPTMDEPPWAVEKYPLPDMDRENVREDGEREEDDENEEQGEGRGREEQDEGRERGESDENEEGHEREDQGEGREREE